MLVATLRLAPASAAIRAAYLAAAEAPNGLRHAYPLIFARIGRLASDARADRDHDAVGLLASPEHTPMSPEPEMARPLPAPPTDLGDSVLV